VETGNPEDLGDFQANGVGIRIIHITDVYVLQLVELAENEEVLLGSSK
jgi:hypothetical protein